MKGLGIRERLLSDDLLKRVYIYSFICGILAHGSVMTKAIFWHDGLKCAFHVNVNDALKLGRWLRAFLAHIVARMFGGANPSLPMLYGVISLFFIAASAYVIIRLLNIENKSLQLILCGLMVSFPAVTSTFGYMFTAPYYFLGLFLSTIAVLAARRWPGAGGFLAGALCLCCSLGIYQAYISVSASLFVMLLIFDIINDRYPSVSRFLGNAFYYLGILIVGFVAYYGIWKVCLRVTGVAASDYQGVSSMGSMDINAYLAGIRSAYEKFFLLNLNGRDNLYPMGLKTAQIIAIGLGIACSVGLIVSQLRKNVLFGIALVLLIAMLPLCFNMMYVIGANAVHTVMLYGQCMLYVYLICVMMHAIRKGTRLGIGCYRLTAMALLILVGMNIFFDNGCYMKAELMLQQSINSMNVLVARIKMLDGYSDDMRVCIVPLGEQDATTEKNARLQDFSVMPWNKLTLYGNKLAVNNAKAILSKWCGFTPKYVSYAKFGHKKAIKKMPSYPDDGSIEIIDGTVVVRM